MSVKTIQDELREARDRILSIVNVAREADRELTPDEDKEAKDLEARMQALDKKLKRSADFDALVRSVEGLTPAPALPTNGGGVPLTAQSAIRSPLGGVLPLLGGSKVQLGAHFVEHEAIKRILATPRSGHWSSPVIEIEAAVTITTPPVPPGTVISVPPPVWPFDLVSARFGQGTTDAGSIPHLIETSFTNNAGYVAVGAAKPESVKAFTMASAPLLKIAHIIKVPDEFLDDVAGLRSYLDSNMTGGLVKKLENEVINGPGTAGTIMGLIALPGKTTTVAAVVPPAPLILAIAKAAADVWTVSGRRPDTVVLSPQTYLEVTGQTSSAGGFLLPNLFMSGGAPLAGLTVVQSPAMPANQAIVGAFAEGSMLFRKGGISLQATNTDVDDFQKNITTIRAEMRVAVVHWAPAAYCLVTGLDLTP